MVQRPQAGLQALLSELGLPHALLASSRIAGDMEAETYGRLFIAVLKLAETDRHQHPDPILDLSTYRRMFVYRLQADCLEDAINRAARYYLRFQPEQRSFCLERNGDTVHWRFYLGPADDETPQATSRNGSARCNLESAVGHGFIEKSHCAAMRCLAQGCVQTAFASPMRRAAPGPHQTPALQPCHQVALACWST